MKKLLFLGLLVSVLFTNIYAAPAFPGVIKYIQPDGSVISIQLKGDEAVHWAETADGYTLLSNGKNAWEYATADINGDLKTSGMLAREINKRTPGELKLLKGLSKNIRFSTKQVNILKSVWEAKYASNKLIGAGQFFKKDKLIPTNADGRRNVFSPNGAKKLILILIEYTDVKFTKSRQDFVDLMNSQNYNLNGAEGSVKDYFSEISYNQFTLQTDIAPRVYTANYDMAYYGAPNGSAHDIRANDLMKEAIEKADADVDFSQYDNDADGTVDGVYIIYAGYGEASSGLVNTIWPHAGSISGQTFDGKTITKYSCSNELNANGAITGIGVICHEFAHVCGAPDYYDTDYATGGEFIGTGYWDVMDRGLYNTTIANSGSKPAHINPMEKINAGWLSPTIINSATALTIPDITTNPTVYIYNTTTTNEYYMMENRQKTGFNSACPGHGLMIYHYSKTIWDASRNRTAPQGFYPVCANATTSPGLASNAASYGNINTSGCPFPGTSGKKAFYDNGVPSAKSWAGYDTALPLTNITENANGTISLSVSTITTCNSAPATQASVFTATPQTYNTMNISWVRGSGNKVMVVARDGSAVDMDPFNGTAYTANAHFKTGDEIGAGNYVVYNGTGTSVNLTGLAGGTSYYYSVYEYNDAELCYLTPALTGIATTDCIIDPTSFTENFEQNTFGCWTATDNTGQGNWKIGTYSNRAYTPELSGNFAYFNAELGKVHNYNADLISPTFNLTNYTNVELRFVHLLDAHLSYPSAGTVSYSIDNGASWTALATYTSDTQNPEPQTLTVNAAIGKSQVKFKWNYTCSPTGANYWAVDAIQVADNTNYWTGAASNDWFNTNNWSAGQVPGSTSSVVINTSAAIQPQINATGATCAYLFIQNGASLKLNAKTILNNINIQTGASLVVSAGHELTVNGTFTNNAGNSGFVLQSNANGTATFVDNALIPNTVAATVQQHLSVQRNWYLSLPVSAYTVPLAQDYSLFYYPENDAQQNTNNGAYWLNPTGSLLPTIGYIIKPSTQKTGAVIEFTGTLNSGLITNSELTNSTVNNPAKHGYNLVGNPYPSYIDWNNTSNTNLSTTLWYRTQALDVQGNLVFKNDGITPIYTFFTYLGNPGIGVPASVTNMIPPMQAFWVKVNSGTGTLGFTNASRSHKVDVNLLRAPAAKLSANKILRLRVAAGNIADETVLYFNANAANTFDTFDSPKMLNGTTSSIPDIYTTVGTEQLVINGMKDIPYDTEIPIYFKANASTATSFTLSAPEISNFEAGTQVYIKNNLSAENKIISDGSAYIFQPSAVGSNPVFSVIFKAPGAITDVNNAISNPIFIFANEQGQISINSPYHTDNAHISVYNAQGLLLYRTSTTGKLTVINETFAPGLYVVKVNNVSTKVIIK